MLVWARATRLAIVIVATASQVRIGIQTADWSPNAPASTRIRAANATVFVAAAMKAVTFVGAPVYTSGTHWWNGTIAILKPNPTMTSPRPMVRIAEGRKAAACAMSWRSSDPAPPYSKARP